MIVADPGTPAGEPPNPFQWIGCEPRSQVRFDFVQAVTGDGYLPPKQHLSQRLTRLPQGLQETRHGPEAWRFEASHRRSRRDLDIGLGEF